MSSAAVMLWTALIELLLLPFALRERLRAQAAAKAANRYTGQRNRWQDGAR